MRRTVIAFALPFVTALMLVQPVSAEEVDVIYDEQYDTPVWSWGFDGTPFTNLLNSNPPMVQVGYFDMSAYSLSLLSDEKGERYRFWMQVWVPLPTKEEGFPPGIAAGEWLMYIDPGPYQPVENYVVSLFQIGLRFDGAEYSAFLYDYGTGEQTQIEPGSFEHSVYELWMEFPTSVVDDLELELDSLWWAPATKAYLGTDGTAWRLVDCTDYDFDGETWDLPWPVLD
jgi:hypothetical protein